MKDLLSEALYHVQEILHCVQDDVVSFPGVAARTCSTMPKTVIVAKILITIYKSGEYQMKLMLKSLSAITLSFSTLVAFAAPSYMTTTNTTTEESNAYVAGVPSPYPTKAQSTRKVAWNLVRIACYGHTDSAGNCTALIKMATNTANPITVGTMSMNINTGDVNPKVLSANGYTFTVTGLGEAVITKN